MERLFSLRPYAVWWWLPAVLAGLALAIALQKAVLLSAVLFAVLFGAAVPQLTTVVIRNHLTRRFVLAVGLLLAGIGVFNFAVNPLGLYPTRFFNPILLTSQTDKVRLLLAYPVKPEALILGNSRTFSIDPAQVETLWGYPAFNASVADGTVRDSLALTRFALDRRGALKLLIINVDDLTFLNYGKAQNQAVNPVGLADPVLTHYLDDDAWDAALQGFWDQYSRLFTLQQTDASLRLLQAESEGRNNPLFVFDTDGKAQYYRNMTLEEAVNQGLDHYRQVGYAGWFHPDHLDQNSFQLFQRLLEECQAQGIAVLAYLPPGHPRYQQYLETEGQGYAVYHQLLLDRLAGFEQQYPFHVVDFTYRTTELFGEDLEPYFSDTIHPNHDGSRRIVQVLHDTYPLLGDRP